VTSRTTEGLLALREGKLLAVVEENGMDKREMEVWNSKGKIIDHGKEN